MANPPNLQELANAFERLQVQFTQAQGQISELSNLLGQANQNNAQLQQRLLGQEIQPRSKLRKPESYKGKGSIQSWIMHMDNYTNGAPPDQAMAIAVSFLDGNAHEWWIVHSSTNEGRDISTWDHLKQALLKRFQPLNKTKIARDRLAKWKQLKDVPSFNEEFLRIILDIPNISEEEKIDRYTRALKPYVWKEMCTNEYAELSEAMADAERIEAAHRRINKKSLRTSMTSRSSYGSSDSGVTPMELGNIKLKKLTPAERELCRKEGRCFRCREKGHSFRDCPKAKRN